MKIRENHAKPEEFFFETSVQIKSILGGNFQKEEIRKIRKKSPCYSSFFVLSEFKRSLISALIDFYFLLDSGYDVSEALTELSEEYHPRKIKFIVAALGQIIKQGELENNKDKCLLKIENLIEKSLQAFELNINKNYIENKVKCDQSTVSLITDKEKSVKENYDLFKEKMSCRKGKTKCNCREFFKNNKSSLKKLLEYENQNGYNNNNGYKEAVPKYKLVLENCAAAEGNNCKALGDTIIAIECPKDKTLLTLDKAFDALCPILNKNHKRLPSEKALKENASLNPYCR